MKNQYRIIFIIFLFSLSFGISAKANHAKIIFGWVEPVKLFPYKINMRAKFDTGAKTSSLDAKVLKYYKYKGKRFVRFQFYYQKYKKLIVEKPVLRFVKIKQRNPRSQFWIDTRPVVSFRICLGKQSHQIAINLASRQAMQYRLLLGRAAIKKFSALIDVTKKMTKNARCRY